MLAAQVRHVLSEAGFYLVAETGEGMPGLWVSEVPEGVLVRWAASEAFTALAASQSGRASNDSMRAVVQAAVSGLLMQQGHIVTAAEHDGILVLAPAARSIGQR
ncbi:hypothetical protein ABZ281_08025 [Streptomyces sp. NPDC006265]|uniref:hypothetical protein n=1 Tax=Streptomyces sp. NPDC006265 TaxID=3156740 RepID=UPI0033BAB616